MSKPLSRDKRMMLVFGYIRKQQNSLMPTYSSLYSIPSSIILICFSYYYQGGDIQRRFKTVLLGEASVGKSSIMTRFVRDDFLLPYSSTIGAAFSTKSCIVDEYTIKYEVWDTAGQERFRTLAPMYYRGAHIAILVYDITDKESAERMKAWMEELRRHFKDKEIVIGIAANKSDLDDRRMVDSNEMKQYAEKNNAMFFETSAKRNRNIKELFEQLGYRAAIEQPKEDENKIWIDQEDMQSEAHYSVGCAC